MLKFEAGPPPVTPTVCQSSVSIVVRTEVVSSVVDDSVDVLGVASPCEAKKSRLNTYFSKQTALERNESSTHQTKSGKQHASEVVGTTAAPPQKWRCTAHKKDVNCSTSHHFEFSLLLLRGSTSPPPPPSFPCFFEVVLLWC